MLLEIRCDKFKQESIVFHEGLNVVLGDEKASNSIGKSDMLFVIDFVYGGNDYPSEDVIENVGHHEIQFCFEFDGKLYHFVRSTADKDTVKVQKEETNDRLLTIDEYTAWLKKMYGSESVKASLRQMVGQYGRIYGKENISEKNPLQIVHKESDEKAIDRLLQNFEEYKSLEALKAAQDEAEKRWDAIRKAANEQIIFVRTGKTNKKDRDAKLQALREEIQGIEAELMAGKCVLSDEQMRVVAGWYEELELMNGHLMRHQSRLRRLNRSAADLRNENQVSLEELKRFFPSIEMRKLEDVNRFHQQLEEILTKEVKEQICETENAIRVLEEKIGALNKQITSALDAKENDAASMAVKRLVDRVVEWERLKLEDKYSGEFEEFKEQKNEAADRFDTAKEELLLGIEERLNKQMEQYNRFVSEDQIYSPRLTLLPKKYNFECKNDKGAGTNYKGLLLLDISMLKMTKLPVLIHDTVLYKNLSDVTMARIISLYQEFQDKQIFITLDKVGQLENAESIYKEAVLQLGEDKEALFGWQWNKVKKN